MIFPRIYSLVTVGIVKHRYYDFFFHRYRTSIVGENALGKSILGDIYQIIIIADIELIKFGTESMDNERSVSTLPYRTHEAFVLLNIEVAPKRFVSIGASIARNAEKNSVLTPFIITRGIPFEGMSPVDISFGLDQLPGNQHFMQDDVVPGRQSLVELFEDQYGLHLKFFDTPKKRQEYFEFLYDFEITSINLKIKKNREIMAQVIQSFSRVKSFDMKDPEDLKNFILDDDGNLHQKEFLEQKGLLEEQIRSYKKLEADISLIVDKQELLSELKLAEERMQDDYRSWILAELVVSHKEVAAMKAKLSKEFEDLSEARQELAQSEQDIPRYARMQGLVDQREKDWLNDRDYLSQYKEAKTAYQRTLSTERQLQAIDVSWITGISVDASKASVLQIEGIWEINAHLSALRETYRTDLNGLLHLCDEQTELLNRTKREFTTELDGLKILIDLFGQRQPQSLFAEIIRSRKALSRGQEAALLYLKDLHMHKPEILNEVRRYTDDPGILDRLEWDPEREGYWLQMGQLYEFVPELTTEPIFGDPDRLQGSLERMLEQYLERQSEILALLQEISNFEKGWDYHLPTLELDRHLDAKDILRQAQILAGIPPYLEATRRESQDLSQSMLELRSKISVDFAEDELESVRDWLQGRCDRLRTRWKRLTQILGRLNHQSQRLLGEIARHEKAWTDCKDDLTEKQIDHLTRTTIARKKYPLLDLQELVENSSIMKGDIEDKRRSFQDSRLKYQHHYEAIARTHGANNPRVQSELTKDLVTDDHCSLFNVIEIEILGKVEHKDQIAGQIRSMNEDREQLIDALTSNIFRIFTHTLNLHEKYLRTIESMNDFFDSVKISNRLRFHIKILDRAGFDIGWIYHWQTKARQMKLEDKVEDFIVEFFKATTGYQGRLNTADLLDPKSYFDLAVELKDDSSDQKPVSSNGQAYTAILLLSIARLNLIQNGDRPGLRFVILEELSSMDAKNFQIFPRIAQDMGYQILTMSPHPFASHADDDAFYMYCLKSGSPDAYVNANPLKFFVSEGVRRDLATHLHTETLH